MTLYENKGAHGGSPWKSYAVISRGVPPVGFWLVARKVPISDWSVTSGGLVNRIGSRHCSHRGPEEKEAKGIPPNTPFVKINTPDSASNCWNVGSSIGPCREITDPELRINRLQGESN
jgi:hypothetical protein